MSQGELLMVTQCFLPTHGGIETLMANLARAIHRSGCPVTVVAKPPKGPFAAFDAGEPYPIHRVTPWIGMLRAPLMRRAVKRAVRANPGLSWVITDSWKAGSVVAPIARRHGLKLVVLAHGNEVTTKNKSSRARRMAAVFSQADRVVANSGYTRGLLAGVGVDERRIEVLPPGIDPGRFNLDAEVDAFRDRWKLSGHKVILTLARIEPRKGHDQVLRALARGGPGIDDTVYVVAGQGDDRGRLETLADELGVAGRVRFVGPVAEAEKSVLYRLCDVFAMPNRPETSGGFSVEGFGIVFLEAALFGKPVIGGDSGGVPDAVAAGETGYLVAPNDLDALVDGLSTLLTDEAAARRMGQNGRERVLAQFTWERIAERYRGVVGL